MPLAPATRVRLEQQLEALPTILGSAGPEALLRRPAAGGWSALENLAHVGRHHEVMLDRLQFFLVHEAHHLYVAMKRARGGD